jgi:uncharacterized membrane protein
LIQRLPAWAQRVTAAALRLPWWTWLAIAGLVGLAVAVGASDPRTRAQVALFLGRFHPLLVHLPIGGLLVAALLAVVSRTARGRRVRVALLPVLLFCAVGAILAVAAGQLLSAGAAYDGSTFTWHRGLGYGVAVLAALAALLAWLAPAIPALRLTLVSDSLLGAAVVLLGITGHLGGTLTHGPGYLTEHMPQALRAWLPGTSADERPAGPARPQQIVAYTALVAPILDDRCVSCHGPDKTSGGLRLDTPAHIRAGGSSGTVLTAGQATSSDLIRRIWLPVTHRDVMPPKERPPITVAEASLLRWWVDQGASFEQTLADMEIADDVKPAIEERVGVLPLGGPAILALDVPPLDASALADVLRRGLPVSRLAEQAHLLQVQGRAMGKAFGDAEVEALAPVAAHVTWLDLGGTAVTDVALATIARFAYLSRLHLDRTGVTDEGLKALHGLEHLEYVNLYATAVTDEGLGVLGNVPHLRTVYLWQTDTTPAGIAALRAANPTLEINTGVPTQAAAAP